MTVYWITCGTVEELRRELRRIPPGAHIGEIRKRPKGYKFCVLIPLPGEFVENMPCTKAVNPYNQ